MAKFNNGNLSGLIGPVVACTLGGKTYLRSRPERSNKPASPAQRAQRTSLGMVRLFVTPFRPVLQLGFAEASSEGNAHNIGIKRNFRRILQGEHPAVSLDYSKAILSEGRLANVTAVTAAAEPGASLLFRWQDNTGCHMAEAGDLVMVVAYSPDLNDVIYSKSAVRKDQLANLAVPSFRGRKVHTWISCARPGKKPLAAGSIYLGEVLIM